MRRERLAQRLGLLEQAAGGVSQSGLRGDVGSSVVGVSQPDFAEGAETFEDQITDLDGIVDAVEDAGVQRVGETALLRVAAAAWSWGEFAQRAGRPVAGIVMEWCPTDMERWWEATWSQPRALAANIKVIAASEAERTASSCCASGLPV